MILFPQDWQEKHPHAVLHKNTANRSWIKMAVMYRDHFKTPNWAWPLALHDRELMDINPHQPASKLGAELVLRILTECEVNPWYFHREIHRIPPRAGSGSNPFRVDRGALATLWLFYNHIDTANIQLRQSGKTIKLEAAILDALVARSLNTSIRYGTKDSELKKKCIEDLKKKLNLLPDYIYRPLKGVDKDNYEVITNMARNNIINFSIGQSNEMSARQAGVGFTTAINLWDEICEMKNAQIIIPAASAASGAVRKEAKAKNQPYANMFSCTAGSLDEPEGEFYFQLASDGMLWSEELYNCVDEADLYDTVKRQSRAGTAPLVNVAMSYRQLGISEEELLDRIAESKIPPGDKDRIDRQFYSRFTYGSIKNPLTKPQLATIFKSEKDPERTKKTKDHYLIKWYCDEATFMEANNVHAIVLGNDTSNASGGDDCALTFTDIRTLEVLGRIDVNETNLTRYAEFIASLLIEFKGVVWAFEHASSGPGVLDTVIIQLLQHDEDPFLRIFNELTQKPAENKKVIEEIERVRESERDEMFYAQYKRYFGFHMGKSSRQQIYSEVLHEAVKMAGSKVRDLTLSTQIRNLIEKNGRVDHPPKGHDDAVISWLLGCWFAIYGRNFDKYGINPRLPLSRAARSESGEISDEELERSILRNHVVELLTSKEEEYMSCMGGLEAIELERELRELGDLLNKLGSDARNLDQMVMDLRERRKHEQRRLSKEASYMNNTQTQNSLFF